MVQGWAERTPDGFTMHVKAFGLMTRHPVKAETIPQDLRDEMPVDERGRVDRPPRELRGEIFRRFLEALEPLRAAGKLGGILFQLPPYVVYKDASLDYLEWAREQLGGDEMLVEFRHRSWLDDENRAASLAFLERIGAGYVIVDAPRSDTAKNLVPTVVATTSPTAYVRFHGRNLGTWNKRGGSAAERFDYLYSDEELGEWIEPLRELAGQAENAYAFFNNNASSEDPDNPLRRVAQAATNARQLRRLLDVNRIAAGRRMDVNVLSVVHGEDAGAELFGPLVAEAGHRLEEWSFERAAAAARSTLRRRPRLRRRDASRPGRPAPVAAGRARLARASCSSGVPTLGICLGSELLARAAGAWVGPLAAPEVGWGEVELTTAGAADPVSRLLPPRFDGARVAPLRPRPAGRRGRARRKRGVAAGVPTRRAAGASSSTPRSPSPSSSAGSATRRPAARSASACGTRRASEIGEWNELGRRLCRSFLAAAERLMSAAGAACTGALRRGSRACIASVALREKRRRLRFGIALPISSGRPARRDEEIPLRQARFIASAAPTGFAVPKTSAGPPARLAGRSGRTASPS